MNSFQESKNELEAAIRYAENAISSAQGTIESMEFRQEMAKKQYAEQTGRESMLEGEVSELTTQVDEAFRKNQSLTKLVKELEAMNENLANDNYKLEREVQERDSKVQGQYDDIVVLERRLEEVKTNMALMTDENERLKAEVNALEQPERATMPVIPKAVAIAIFREGVAHGVAAACTEIDNAPEICIEESEYCGGFEVSFSQDVDLSDHLDTDWMRDKCGDYSEQYVIDALGNLCADNEFECRIHGVDDQEQKNAD